jgi:hypothetical protein
MTPGAHDIALAYLRALAGPEEGTDLVELRYRRGERMRRCFFEGSQLVQAAHVALALGERTDIYVGIAPRRVRAGGRHAVRQSWAIWADCDDAAARERLWDFAPAPSIVVRTGSPDACHAYWLLHSPLTADGVERANRRLAAALGSDARAVDAARILRPPGTRNFKYEPPRPVELERFVLDRFDARSVVGSLPDPPGVQSRSSADRRNADPLRAIPPDVYVEALLGVRIPRSRKVLCPFHDDHTPSLHVYTTADRGWYCFGCGRGTSIYELGAAVYGLSTRGDDFRELRRRLHALLFNGARAA